MRNTDKTLKNELKIWMKKLVSMGLIYISE